MRYPLLLIPFDELANYKGKIKMDC